MDQSLAQTDQPVAQRVEAKAQTIEPVAGAFSAEYRSGFETDWVAVSCDLTLACYHLEKLNLSIKII